MESGPDEIIDVDYDDDDDVFGDEQKSPAVAPPSLNVSKPRAQSLSALPKKKADEPKSNRKSGQVRRNIYVGVIIYLCSRSLH